MTDSIASDFLSHEGKESWADDEKLRIFEDALGLILDPKIRNFTAFILSKAEAFWVAPVTDQIYDPYPVDEMDEGGMVLHANRAVRAFLLLEPVLELSNDERDCAISALLIRNVTKAVWIDEERSKFAHDPVHLYTVDSFVNSVIAYAQTEGEDMGALLGADNDSIGVILRLVRASGGAQSLIPETFPSTLLEKAVYFADVVATAAMAVLYNDD